MAKKITIEKVYPIIKWICIGIAAFFILRFLRV